jgi:hypothetical protein
MSRMVWLAAVWGCVGGMGWGVLPAAEEVETTTDSEFAPVTPIQAPQVRGTHKQVRTIRPMHNGQPIHLNTYCLSPSGDILACVGGSNYTYEPDGQGGYRSIQSLSQTFVQVYSPEGELKAEWAVPFKPTAINVAPDRTIFVAGEGKLARLSSQGALLTTANIPQEGDPEKLRQEAIAKAREQQAEFIARLEKQIEFAQQQAEKIRAVPEAERTKSQAARLQAYERQVELYQAQIKSLQEQEIEVSVSAVSRSGVVTGLAVSDQHLFVCTGSVSGAGYDVIRCDFDFQNPKRVLTGLRGCCGQMDIQALGERLVVAENTKFQVALHDPDGKPLTAFGGRDRTGGAGFGSCCNPMNVRCCANGEILTAESSIGDIKRFSADGKLLAYIGRAKISGGCKHVAIDWDPKRDRYYMMNVADSSICVLVPLSEAPEFTEEELAAKAAREGLGRKLVGAWRLPGTKTVRKQPESALGLAIRTLLSGGSSSAESSRTDIPFEAVMFRLDGTLDLSGGVYGQWGTSGWQWSAVRQDEAARTVDFDLLIDGIQYVSLRAEIVNDDTIKFSALSGNRTTMTGTFERVTQENQAGAPTDAPPTIEEPASAVAEPAPAPGS